VSERGALDRGDWPWLLSLLIVGCLALGTFALAAYRFTDGQGGVPLDDAWIHFQFARNLARGDGLSFNPGDPTSGSTAPLWTLLLAAVYRVGGRFPVGGQALSGVCFLALLVVTYALGKRLAGSRWAAWLAGALVAVNGRMVWAGLSALETCLFAALTLWAIGAHLGDVRAGVYRARTAALFALAALSRPEGYLLFALSLADFAWHTGRQVNATRNTNQEPRVACCVLRVACCVLRSVLLPAAVFTALVSPYLLFSLFTSGHLLPNTYHAKAVVDLRPDTAFLSVAARYLVLDNPILLPLYVLGVALLFWPRLSPLRPGLRASLLGLWSAGLPLVYAFLHAVLYQHGRYLIPLVPCNALIGLVGLLGAQRLAHRRGWLHVLLVPQGSWGRPRGGIWVRLVVITLLIVAGTAWRLPTMARLYAWNVDNINEMHVALGRWVVAHTAPDALLALNDIGAITYISERPVLDLAGLITPEVVPILHMAERDARLADLLTEQGVDYVLVFPNWFPDLAERRDLLEPVHRVTLERNTICGGQTMVVYRAHWRR